MLEIASYVRYWRIWPWWYAPALEKSLIAFLGIVCWHCSVPFQRKSPELIFAHQPQHPTASFCAWCQPAPAPICKPSRTGQRLGLDRGKCDYLSVERLLGRVVLISEERPFYLALIFQLSAIGFFFLLLPWTYFKPSTIFVVQQK